MIYHEYDIKFIVPSIQIEPNIEEWFMQLAGMFATKGQTLNGVKFGHEADYTKGMTVVVSPLPLPPPPPPKAPSEQLDNLMVKDKKAKK